MALTDWQQNFARLVTSPPGTPAHLTGELTEAEREWLTVLADSPGFMVARLLQRRRRQECLREHARLTVSAASRAGEGDLVEAYLDAFPSPAPLATLEAIRFLDMVQARTEDYLVVSVAKFERAIVDAAEERMRRAGDDSDRPIDPDATLRVHPWRVIVMPARAEDVIVSVALGESLPLLDRNPVIVGPGLPSLWREASRAEDVVCSWLTRPRSLRDVTRVFPGFEPAVQGLIEAGVVRSGNPGT